MLMETFRRIPLTILRPANKIEQNFHFPQFGHLHRKKSFGTPNEIERNRIIWNKIECSWVRYLDKQKSDIFMFRNGKPGQKTYRGERKLETSPPLPQKIFAQGKLNGKKSHARQLTLKNICFKSPKKIDTRKMLAPKNSCGSKIPHPPITFLMVRS